MESLRGAITGGVLDRSGPDEGCRCDPEFDGDRLTIDATACPDEGRLAESEHCRATVVRQLADRDVDAVHVTHAGVERIYDDGAAALLVAAGRFLEAVQFRDERLADRVAADPLGAAREATGRAGPVADIAAETGLATAAEQACGYDTALSPRVGLAVSDWRVQTAVPPGATLTERRELDTGSAVRIYEVPAGRDRYVLAPAGHDLGTDATATLAAAYERLAAGHVTGGDRAAGRAVRTVVDDGAVDGVTSAGDLPVERVAQILHKHTRGQGLLADFFADPEVSDAFVTAPPTETPISVRVGDRQLPTNVRLTDRGVRSLASRYRRESGRGFSRADPTLDAATSVRDRQVRVAAVTDPASDGVAFAFRAHDRDVWTLPALVENDTLSPRAAAVLSLAVERGSAVLVAGPRGAGKTTLLGALLWELPPAVRTVVIEDAPELPVGPLQGHGRDVQLLRAATEGAVSPAEALRTALRLGDGAIVIGEVRGEEAGVLYEAMRVGASDDAVLGTIHGDGADDVFERVVSDLGVPETSFGATDLVVTLSSGADGQRCVHRIEEVLDARPDCFEPLYARPESGLEATDRIDRGNSHLVEELRHPGETYADVRDALSGRADQLSALAGAGRTGGHAVNSAVLERTS